MAALSQAFDDVVIGDTFSTPSRTVCETDVLGFASLTRDLHPLHTDAEWAKASRFGQRTAHGFLVLSYAAGLVPFDPQYAVALRRVRQAVFKRPVFIDDTIRVDGKITSKQALSDGQGLVECSWKVLNQRGQVVVRAQVEIVWGNGSVGGGAPAIDPDDDEWLTSGPVLA
jgi:3-hydroxybutyryl-CoA dehydratase